MKILFLCLHVAYLLTYLLSGLIPVETNGGEPGDALLGDISTQAEKIVEHIEQDDSLMDDTPKSVKDRM